MKPRKVWIRSATAMVAAIAVGACGSSSTSGRSSTVAPSTTDAGTSGSSVSGSIGPSVTLAPASNSTTLAPASGSTTSAGTANLPDPCKLVSVADAEVVLGAGVTSRPGDSIGSPANPAQVPNSCTYEAGTSSNKLLVVSVRGPVTAQEFATTQTQFVATAVTGLGDAAFVAQGDALVAVLKGTIRVFLARSNPLTDQAHIDQLTALAKKAIAKL